MRQVGLMQWLDILQPIRLGALMVALVVLLASCSNTSVLTDSGTTGPKGKPVPPVAFQQITGLPPGKLADMKTALAVAGGQRDIGFVEGSFQTGNLTIAGQFKVMASSSGVTIVYQWQVRDADGVLLQTIDGDDNAGVFAGADPWAAVNSSVIERIARRTVETLAQKLSQMGYATRLAALTVPPAEYFVAAGPDAQREVDFETVNGPGMAGLGMDMIANADQVLPKEEPDTEHAALKPIPGEAQLARAMVAEEVTAATAPEETVKTASAESAKTDAEQPAKTTSKPDQPQIRAVALMPVEGSPGSGGDAELTAALRKTLIDAGWPVVNKPQPDALTIVGRVRVAEKGAGNQSVSVRWVVRSPNGKTLGDVKQANDVPRGALDSGWGPVAFAVAESAATGIFDIVRRFQ